MLGQWPKPKLDDGHDAWPKGFGEDPKNSLYLMPWAEVETDKNGS